LKTLPLGADKEKGAATLTPLKLVVRLKSVLYNYNVIQKEVKQFL